METRRWINQSQPQTLYIATMLLYFGAAVGLFLGSIYFFFGRAIGVAALVGLVAAAYGIANERRWGYRLGVALTAAGVLVGMFFLAGDIGLLFDLQFIIFMVWPVARFILLIHPQSREYQRIWFK